MSLNGKKLKRWYGEKRSEQLQKKYARKTIRKRAKAIQYQTEEKEAMAYAKAKAKLKYAKKLKALKSGKTATTRVANFLLGPAPKKRKTTRKRKAAPKRRRAAPKRRRTTTTSRRRRRAMYKYSYT